MLAKEKLAGRLVSYGVHTLSGVILLMGTLFESTTEVILPVVETKTVGMTAMKKAYMAKT